MLLKIGKFWEILPEKSTHLLKKWQRHISLIMLVILFLVGMILPSTAQRVGLKLLASDLNNTEKLAQQGRDLYEAKRFGDAIEILQQVARNYAAEGDKLRQAMTLRNLSLAEQELGLWTEAQTAIAQSLELLEALEKSPERSLLLAQTLDVKGRWQLKRGQTEAALQTWQQAADLYTQIGEHTQLIRNRINSAQALQVLGFYSQAQKMLINVQKKLESQVESPLKATGLRSLGDVLQAIGDLDQSTQILQQSLKVALSFQANQQVAEALISLANTARLKGDIQGTFNFYQQALNISIPTSTRVQLLLNQFSLLVERKQWQTAAELSPQIQSEINQLPPSRMAIYAQVNFAQNLAKLKQKSTLDIHSWLDIAQILAKAMEQGQSLEDKRAESYAMGTLGWLYMQTDQLANAEDLTKKALLISNSIQASDISYQWQWQLGRLLKTRGDIKEALTLYNSAYKTLQSLRSDLVAFNSDVQFSFRENVEPVYRELVDLLLQTDKDITTSGSKELANNQERLQQARDVIESLQLAELDNFFRSACLQPKQTIDLVVEQQDPQAAFIYPIILPDRLEVILKLPSQEKLLQHKTIVAQDKFENTITELRKYLLDVTATIKVQQKSHQVYDWLIRPIETELTNSGIKTLVFVMDGVLRNIPIAVLYDQQQEKYLVEKYAIAYAPSLQIIEPKPLQNIKLSILTGGVGEQRRIENREFPTLQNVGRELAEIRSQVSLSQQLFNHTFTKTNLQKQLKSKFFSVVHIATHGEFSSNPEETFILTWDKLLKAKDFENLVKLSEFNQISPIELLVLSACQTARGDKRAALGLAGIAVRAGARSTLATLWSVDDKSVTEGMSRFYQQLKTGVNKSAALQNMQLFLMNQDKRPYFWSSYVLLGNWL
ncbi:CHAT domain-containing protein [Nostoc sp. UHCC 0870]|uniref:CHAT domain-containing protein n=1 Tax=Nostoc sp. UHCC 0870 TaxID=2914041 RepID=UPI001EDCE314|nr:CHAT domain-containing protein [Nostoc sp. UHCC 0870]UKO95919.1 CHAT domain-containing protein [Nostoc sp. UHCC 0870]